jgi:membrane-associated phospholipid phosphatase
MRSSTLALAVALSFTAPSLYAQQWTIAPVPALSANHGDSFSHAVEAQETQNTDPQQKPPDKKQQPPAAVGEQGKKPVRNFPSALLHNLGDDIRHMPRRNSLYWLAGGSALALAVHPADHDINGHLAGSRLENDAWKPGSYIGEGYVVAPAAVATYLVGRWDHNERLTHLGMDEIEGAILAEGIVEALKVSVRRDRPQQNVGQPITATGYSFPSGHATLTFEAATILQQHLGYRAGIPTYLIATYVAMSRLHDNVHFASDVAFGAGLGILIGRSVTWHGRNFWGYNMDVMPLTMPGGAGIMISLNAAPPERDH